MKHKVTNVFRKPILEKILSGSTVSGLTPDCLIVLLYELNLHIKKNILVFMESSEFAFDFYNKGYEFDKQVFSYLPDIKNESNVPGFERESSRYRKESLLKSSSALGVVCFGTKVSFEQPLASKRYKKDIKTLSFSVGEKINREGLISFLGGLAYTKVGMVENTSEYALRGDILDFFPSHLRNPIRVSFSFEEVESICVFDPVNQHPISHLNRILLKDVFDPQVSDIINFIEHSTPAISFFCEPREDLLCLVGSNKTKNIKLSASVFSHTKDIHGKNDLYKRTTNFHTK